MKVRTSMGSTSRGHFEEEVQAEEKEDQVGRPGGEEGRKLADAAHGFRQRGDGPIGDADPNAEGHAADGAAATHQKSEGNRQHHADGGDQRDRQAFVPLHGERRDIEAGAVKAVDIAAQIAPVHLEA